MQPTLNNNLSGGRVEYGYIDNHQKAIDSIERFDIVTPYYWWESNDYDQPYVKGSTHKDTADYKIKRVLALPGERFYIENGAFYLYENDKFVKYDDEASGENERVFPFKRSFTDPVKSKTDPYFTYKEYMNKPLGNDCYWVQGDHWSNSSDSLYNKKPIYKENIAGVLVAIQGTAIPKLVDGKMTMTEMQPYSEPRYFKER